MFLTRKQYDAVVVAFGGEFAKLTGLRGKWCLAGVEYAGPEWQVRRLATLAGMLAEEGE